MHAQDVVLYGVDQYEEAGVEVEVYDIAVVL